MQREASVPPIQVHPARAFAALLLHDVDRARERASRRAYAADATHIAPNGRVSSAASHAHSSTSRSDEIHSRKLSLPSR